MWRGIGTAHNLTFCHFLPAQVEVGSVSDALGALRRGSRQRQRAETGLNYSSSRSHSIFTVQLHQRATHQATEGAGHLEVS